MGCDTDCSQAISACMMAHINTSGTHIPLWMDSPDSALGWGISPSFPTREGTFFGQIMVTNPQNNLDAYFCDGPSTDQNIVPGRLGANQGYVPYANAYPKTAGMDGLCDTSHSTGRLHERTRRTAWLMRTRLARSMASRTSTPSRCGAAPPTRPSPPEGGAWVNNGNSCLAGQSGCTWTPGALGFNASNCNTPGTNGCAIIVDANNGMGQRVGYIGPSKGVKFSNVAAASSSANVIVYYTNGDMYFQNRNLSFSVNGGAGQVRSFGGLEDWSHPRGAAITLSGFTVGGNNTVTVTGDAVINAPDLDWIEVVDVALDSSPRRASASRPHVERHLPYQRQRHGEPTSSTAPSTPTSPPVAWNANNMPTRWTSGTSSFAGQYVPDRLHRHRQPQHRSLWTIRTTARRATSPAPTPSTPRRTWLHLPARRRSRRARALCEPDHHLLHRGGGPRHPHQGDEHHLQRRTLVVSIGDIQTDCNLTM